METISYYVIAATAGHDTTASAMAGGLQALVGFGVHYCLGHLLARMELKALFAELLPRLRSVELAGPPELMQTLFVGGLTRLPIRYELR